ncbi:N-formimino-L-glutamate deiminase [compost metagenome]
MVRRQGPIAGGQRCAMQRRQLLGMQLHGQVQVLCCLEHPFNLLGRKRQMLAERIDRINQPFGRQHRQHAPRHFVDIVIPPPREFRWQRVRRKTGGLHGHRQCLPQTPRHAQHLAFIGQVQAIA